MTNELEQHFLDDWRNKWFTWQKQCNGYLDTNGNNPNITFEMMAQNPQIDWGTFDIMENPNIKMDTIFEYIRQKYGASWTRWNIGFIGKNPNFTFEAFMKLENNYDIHEMYHISSNKVITMDIITAHPDIPWDWHGIVANPNTTLDFMQTHPNKREYFNAFCMNPSIQLDDIVANDTINEQCNRNGYTVFNYLSSNPQLTIQFVINNIQENWRWSYVSENVGIKMKDILDHPELPWNMECVCDNPNLTIDAIIQLKLLPTYNRIYRAPFNDDRNAYIANNVKNANVIAIYRHYLQYNNPATFDFSITFNNIERVFLDEYLVKMMLEY